MQQLENTTVYCLPPNQYFSLQKAGIVKIELTLRHTLRNLASRASASSESWSRPSMSFDLFSNVSAAKTVSAHAKERVGLHDLTERFNYEQGTIKGAFLSACQTGNTTGPLHNYPPFLTQLATTADCWKNRNRQQKYILSQLNIISDMNARCWPFMK